MALRAVIVWLVLLVVAIAVGAVRQRLLVPWVGEPVAHVLGTLLVIAVFVAIIARTVGWIEPELALARLLLLGLAWTLATVLFEFSFGRWVAGYSWDRLLGDYNLVAGRLWTLVLAAILFTPPIAGAWLRRSR